MLTCLPRSLCSWDFRVSGAPSGPAELSFNFFTEQGGISVGGAKYSVRKHGMLSGRWTLERDDTGQICAEARKPSAYFRAFELSSGGERLTVKAQSSFTRCYDILEKG